MLYSFSAADARKGFLKNVLFYLRNIFHCSKRSNNNNMRLHSVFVCCPPMLSRFVDLRARSLYARIKMNPLRAYVSVQIIIRTNRSLIINRNVYILLFPASSRSRPRRNLSLFLMTSEFFHLLVFFIFFYYYRLTNQYTLL